MAVQSEIDGLRTSLELFEERSDFSSWETAGVVEEVDK